MVDESVMHREISALAGSKFHKLHGELEIQAQIDSLDSSHDFHKKHMDLEVRARVDSMEVNHAAEMQFNTENLDAASEKKDLYRENADKYYAEKAKRG